MFFHKLLVLLYLFIYSFSHLFIYFDQLDVKLDFCLEMEEVRHFFCISDRWKHVKNNIQAVKTSGEQQPIRSDLVVVISAVGGCSFWADPVQHPGLLQSRCCDRQWLKCHP